MAKARKKAAKKATKRKATKTAEPAAKRKAAAKKRSPARKRKASRRSSEPAISTGKKGSAGRPPFVATPENRRQVESLAATGALKQEQIALLVINPDTGQPVSVKTLCRHFRHELDTAALKANSMVAQSLFKKATGSGTGAVTAGIWWEKTRTGMRETVSVEVETKSGVLVSPAGATPEQWIADAARKAGEAKEPGAAVDPR